MLLLLFTRVRRSLTDLSPLSRELLVLGACIIAGLVLVPLLIWFVGTRALGPYTHGSNSHAGPFALLSDFLVGLGHGEITYWLVALGPAVLIVLLRVFIAVLRPRPQATPTPDVRRHSADRHAGIK